MVWSSGAWRVWHADETTGVAQTRTLTLADGSHVVLNARTAIDVAMAAPRRRITLLEGEAFFAVAPDAHRPFEVLVDGVTVTARGTAFDVDRRDDGEIAVAVSEHAVDVAPRRGGPIAVDAGRRATIDSDGGVGPVEDVDPANVGRWRNGLFVAENRPLGAVVEALRAYHRGWIVMRDPALARLKVNAVLDLKSPEAALRTLAQGLPIEISTVSPYVILIEPR